MAVFVVLGSEEGIVERDRVDVLHVGILQEIGIDVEKHRHIHSLLLVQSLLFETEALDLAEVWRNLSRCDTVCGHAYDVFIALVRCCIECQCSLAG